MHSRFNKDERDGKFNEGDVMVNACQGLHLCSAYSEMSIDTVLWMAKTTMANDNDNNNRTTDTNNVIQFSIVSLRLVVVTKMTSLNLSWKEARVSTHAFCGCIRR